VIIDKTRHNADSEDRKGREVIGWETGDTSTDFEVIRNVINAQKLLAAE
jgi:hypothetical protein